MVAIFFGVALIIAESVRSYGQGRPFFAWFDDFVIALFYFFCGYMAWYRASNIKYLSAAFALCLAGMTMSYLSKVLNPEMEIYSNISFELLTGLLLAAMVVSIIGMIWTLAVDFEK